MVKSYRGVKLRPGVKATPRAHTCVCRGARSGTCRTFHRSGYTYICYIVNESIKLNTTQLTGGLDADRTGTGLPTHRLAHRLAYSTIASGEASGTSTASQLDQV